MITENFCFIKSDGKQYKNDFSDIQFVEAYGNVLKVHLQEKVLITAETMTEMQSRLPVNLFLRVHKSFLINKEKISKIDGNQIFTGNQVIPIGTSYRQDVLLRLDIK
jgi:two-component system LytT family response regulator